MGLVQGPEAEVKVGVVGVVWRQNGRLVCAVSIHLRS